MGDDSTVYEGTLKSYSDRNGFGFLECQTTKMIYGCDVFVHRSEGQRMSIGSRVNFKVHLNKKGQPQANNVEVVGHQDSPEVRIPVHTGTVDQNSAGPCGLAGPFLGRVNSQQGHGFITCDETQLLYNADVHLNEIEGQGLQLGQEVYFQVHVNPQGQPQAARVSAVSRKRAYRNLSIAQQVPVMLPPMEGEANWQQATGWTLEALQQAQWQSQCWQHDGLFSGTVKNFNHEKGYGFIQCDETFPHVHSDIFFYQNEADDLQVGSQVSFRINFNGNGQLQANSVTAVGGVAKRARTDAGPSSTGPSSTGPSSTQEEENPLPLFPAGPFIGQVKSYNSTTGYGFIECAVTKALFGQDVFLHKRHVKEGMDVGSKVAFQVRLHKLSQPQADNVEIIEDEVT